MMADNREWSSYNLLFKLDFNGTIYICTTVEGLSTCKMYTLFIKPDTTEAMVGFQTELLIPGVTTGLIDQHELSDLNIVFGL